MRRGKVTLVERDILLYIGTFRNENGYPPTVREIAEAVGLRSASSVQMHLNDLEGAGIIKRDRNRSRALVIKTAAGRSIS